MSERTRTLRESFDRSFAEAIRDKPAMASLLAVRVGSDRYAVRLEEVAALHRDKAVTRAASTLPELLGLAGFRGVIAPVYDLATFLGYPRAEAPRWLVLVRGPVPVSFAFETFDAHLHVEAKRLSAEPHASRPHLDGVLEDAEGSRALIRLASIVEVISQRARAASPDKDG